MSGPKTDEAWLRREREEQLRRARQKRLEASNRVLSIISSIENEFVNDIDFKIYDNDIKMKCKDIINIKKQSISQLNSIIIDLKNGTELLDVDELVSKASSIEKNFYIKEDENEDIIKILKSVSQREKQKQLKKKNINKFFTDNLSSQEQDKVLEKEIKEQVDRFEDDIEEMMEKIITSKQKNSILRVSQELRKICDMDILVDRKKMKIKRLFEDYENLKYLISDEMEEFNILYREYLNECFDLDTKPMALNEFKDKEQLETMIISTRKDAQKRLSKDYIKRQIDEVMAKHGYDIVKSDVLNKTSNNGRSLYETSEDTAIDVFVSDDSNVTMRVVGVGFDTHISDMENEQLYKEQCAFCGMHPQITAELAMRGVILHAKNHMPPDRKYNKKIQTNTRSENSMNNRRRSKKVMNTNNNKRMYKE